MSSLIVSLSNIIVTNLFGCGINTLIRLRFPASRTPYDEALADGLLPIYGILDTFRSLTMYAAASSWNRKALGWTRLNSTRWCCCCHNRWNCELPCHRPKQMGAYWLLSAVEYRGRDTGGTGIARWGRRFMPNRATLEITQSGAAHERAARPEHEISSVNSGSGAELHHVERTSNNSV